MDAREIRIGNLINVFSTNKVFESFITDAKGYDLIRCEEKAFNYWSYEPIPLTEEWLLRFKEIQRIDEVLFSIDGERYIELTFKGDGYNVDVGGIVICFVDTVHALQNLYFALTNQELCVK